MVLTYVLVTAAILDMWDGRFVERPDPSLACKTDGVSALEPDGHLADETGPPKEDASVIKESVKSSVATVPANWNPG